MNELKNALIGKNRPAGDSQALLAQANRTSQPILSLLQG